MASQGGGEYRPFRANKNASLSHRALPYAGV